MDIKKYVLKQSYKDNWDIYQKTLEKSYQAPKWDIIVITASNEAQASAYRLQIENRRESGTIPEETEFIVIADPDDKRVGSGGSTINVLYVLYSKLVKANKDSNPFKGKRIAIIHSGGDSKRLPQYSAFGKLFSKVPRELPDGRYSTLFDEFVISLSGIPSRMLEGVFIASGDALLVFNYNQIDLSRQGAVGISIKEPADMGTRHGVFVQGKNQKVDLFLHKMPIETLKSENAIDNEGNVNIDTGMIWIDSDIAMSLTDLVLTNGILDEAKFGNYVNNKIRLNFYGDFIIPLTESAIEENYYKEPTEGVFCDELISARKGIWNALRGYKMYLQILSPAEFIHFGTTKEFRDIMINFDNDYDYLNWSKNVVSLNKTNNQNDICLINAYISNEVEVEKNVFIEDSIIKTKCRFSTGSVISNIHLESSKIEIQNDIVLHTLPVNVAGLGTGYITRIYGVYDNPKLNVENGNATFLNRSLREFVDNAGIPTDAIWDKDKSKDLWNAKLFPFSTDRETSIVMSAKLQRIDLMTEEEKKKWIETRRFSLSESYQLANQKSILEYQRKTEDFIRVESFCDLSMRKVYVNDSLKILGKSCSDICRRVILLFERSGKEKNELARVRLYRALAEVVHRNPQIVNYKVGDISIKSWREYENIAYSELQKAIKNSIEIKSHDGIKLKKEHDVCEAYARVDFGGGWSDTPPYSLEMGGTVLNAAISLNGKCPIKVETRVLEEPVIICESMDLDFAKKYDSIADLYRFNDPADPLALHKAALIAAGVIPLEKNVTKEVSLTELVKIIGGGIYIKTEVNIPKGSGLGTSSILAAAVLKSLNNIIGNDITDTELFEQVLLLEQLLTTGGGWQDQVGGIIPGIKLIKSKPGIKQEITYDLLKLDNNTINQLNERFVVLYTGQRRLAKGILRDIMGDYILNSPSKIKYLYEIQRIAVLMKFELEKGNIDAFAELMNEHFRINKLIDAGSTNNYIDQIIEICRPYISSVKMCGAGGGGFAQMLLKRGEDKEALGRILQGTFKENCVGLWDCRIEG